jgi:hypothetical protein
LFHTAGLTRPLCTLVSVGAGRGGDHLVSVCAALNGTIVAAARLLAALTARHPDMLSAEASCRAIMAGGALAPDALALGLVYCRPGESGGEAPGMRALQRALVSPSLDALRHASTPWAKAALGCLAVGVEAKGAAALSDPRVNDTAAIHRMLDFLLA